VIRLDGIYPEPNGRKSNKGFWDVPLNILKNNPSQMV